MLHECGQALHQDIGDQHNDKNSGNGQCRDAVGAKARFGAVPSPHARLRFLGCEVEASPSSGAPVKAMTSVILLSISVHDVERDQVQHQRYEEED